MFLLLFYHQSSQDHNLIVASWENPPFGASMITCIMFVNIVYLVNLVVLFVYPQAFYPPDCTEHEKAWLKVTEDSCKILFLFSTIS